MATSTIVITYTGTDESDVEVQSFTMGGTAYGSITAANKKLARALLKKAADRVTADYAYGWGPGP